MRFPCPHCGSPSTIRNTIPMSKTAGLLRCRCPNDDCGFVFQMGVEVTGYYVESAMANPAIVLQKKPGIGRHWHEGCRFEVGPIPATPRPLNLAEPAPLKRPAEVKELELEEA